MSQGMYTGSPTVGLGSPNASLYHFGSEDVVYTAVLPKNSNGVHASGFLQQGDSPSTPTELTIEWAISKCPGDMNWYKTAEASFAGGRSGTTFPCGAFTGAATGAIYWRAGGSSYECPITSDGTWYINVRYIANCPSGQSCPITFYHAEYLQ